MHPQAPSYTTIMPLLSRLAPLALLAASTLASAQFTSSGVALRANLIPSSFGASEGNDCWGYTSPSGQEYAIMGLTNSVAFVRVTNPSAPVVVATIPHLTNTWGSIKVYGHHAYAVTERSGSGLQVIDMSQIDSGTVTLVRTIASPGRTHTLAIDETSGFLYACGAREGTGTTMCFSLANPGNPVQVGLPSMTTTYIHEAQAVTYTSGPLAGKQIFFGFSEGRGMDIYDMTNKSAPVMLKRVTYPNIGYSHQGWLSGDKRFIYVNDELDETGQSLPATRSLIFNVEDPENAFYVGSFTTGRPSIDHNEYWDDGFVFQANYRSGLRIFDVENPLIPVETGFFDTYPGSDSAQFNGAWSNYPFLPSGNVIISDIERGLFVVDPTEATTRKRTPESFVAAAGILVGGVPSDLSAADGNAVVIRPGRSSDPSAPESMQLTFTARAYDSNPTRIRLETRTLLADASGQVRTELFNWNTNAYESIANVSTSTTYSNALVSASGNLTRFVRANTLEVRGRLRWQPAGVRRMPTVRVDQARIWITR